MIPKYEITFKNRQTPGIGFTPPQYVTINPVDIVDHIIRGNKMMLIKLLRQVAGKDLRWSKDQIDEMAVLSNADYLLSQRQLDANCHYIWDLFYQYGEVMKGELPAGEVVNRLKPDPSTTIGITRVVSNKKQDLDDQLKKHIIYALDHYREMGLSDPLDTIKKIATEYYMKYLYIDKK